MECINKNVDDCYGERDDVYACVSEMRIATITSRKFCLPRCPFPRYRGKPNPNGFGTSFFDAEECQENASAGQAPPGKLALECKRLMSGWGAQTRLRIRKAPTSRGWLGAWAEPPVLYLPTVSKTALGYFAATHKSTRAAPSSLLRPCSQ